MKIDTNDIDRIAIDDFGKIEIFLHPNPYHEGREDEEDKPEVVLKWDEYHPDTWGDRGGASFKVKKE